MTSGCAAACAPITPKISDEIADAHPMVDHRPEITLGGVDRVDRAEGEILAGTRMAFAAGFDQVVLVDR